MEKLTSLESHSDITNQQRLLLIGYNNVIMVFELSRAIAIGTVSGCHGGGGLRRVVVLLAVRRFGLLSKWMTTF